ncbi:hypothetical protein DSECCO2_542190 [anaerobic digester metagenome]
MLLADVGPDLHAVAEQPVDLAVGVVEALVPADRLRFVEFIEYFVEDLLAMALARETVGEQRLLDVAVAVTVLPVPEVAVLEGVTEVGDDTLLREALTPADGTHAAASSPLPSILCAAFQNVLNTSLRPNHQAYIA